MTPSPLMQQLKERCRLRQKTIMFPESNDERVVQACQMAQREGLFKSILIGHNPGNDLEYRHPDEDPQLKEHAEWYRQHLKRLIPLEEACDDIRENPNLYGALLVRTGITHGGVSGSNSPTASIIRAGLRGIGMERSLISSCFLMIRENTFLGYGDCGVVPVPSLEQLVEIALSPAKTYQLLTQQEPRIAFLSFSTLGSADHSCLDPIRGAVKRLRESHPQLAVDGELQFDAAFLPQVATRKCPNSSVGGKANVFIFPDLNSGNIAYKITKRLGGFVALGPLIQGFKAPWMDLSRGCSVEDILYVAVIATLMDRLI